MTASLRLVDAAHASTWTEQDIKALSEQNPSAALDMAIRKFRNRLYYHAVSIVKNGEEAYDIVQEVFIRAMRETRFFDAEFRMKAWLFRVTSNLCFNRVRDRKRRGAILEAMPMPDRSAPKQVENIFSDQRRVELMAAIDQQTTAHREILLLRYYNDLSYAEIAEVLQVKLGTVMSRLSRARGRLLQTMGDDHVMRPDTN